MFNIEKWKFNMTSIIILPCHIGKISRIDSQDFFISVKLNSDTISTESNVFTLIFIFEYLQKIICLSNHSETLDVHRTTDFGKTFSNSFKEEKQFFKNVW